MGRLINLPRTQHRITSPAGSESADLPRLEKESLLRFELITLYVILRTRDARHRCGHLAERPRYFPTFVTKKPRIRASQARPNHRGSRPGGKIPSRSMNAPLRSTCPTGSGPVHHLASAGSISPRSMRARAGWRRHASRPGDRARDRRQLGGRGPLRRADELHPFRIASVRHAGREDASASSAAIQAALDAVNGTATAFTVRRSDSERNGRWRSAQLRPFR